MEKKIDFKALSFKAKVQYIWDYYRWPIIITVFAAGFVISLIVHYATYRAPVLNVIMINCNDPYNTTDEGFTEFLDSRGYDTSRDTVSLSSNLTFYEDSSYTDRMTLMTMIAAGNDDLFFGRGDIYTGYADEGVLQDLSQILPKETLEKYKDKLLYTTAGEDMDSYPCAIELTDNEWLTQNNYYDTCYFGIFRQTGQLDNCLEFADFLLNY